MKPLFGRDREIERLLQLQKKLKSSLVVIKGRRRIGKSSLAKFFGQKYGNYFFEFTGLAPVLLQTNQDQLDEFLYQLKKQLPSRRDQFKSWGDAFDELNYHLKRKQKVVILLDEISWMGSQDINFPSHLKNAWDLHFSDHTNLILILCGSVSTWIQQNILKASQFVGRISADFTLQELPLKTVSEFWGRWDSKVANFEKLKLVSVLGLVPKYLEEINYSLSAEENINQLCFQPEGFLNTEFDKIFTDIFEKKTKTYKKIAQCLINQNLTASEIAKKLKIELSSSFLEYLENLEISGFISRDYSFSLSKEKSKNSIFRIKDNYLRFALKYIEPSKIKTKNFVPRIRSLEHLPQWSTIVGLQFENMVLNHLDEVLEKMNISISQVLTASSYRQSEKTRNHGACQIDLMIQTRDQTAYICEIKLRNEITRKVISEVERKINILEKKRNWSLRPVLIYGGKINTNDQSEIENYFSKLISVEDLLRSR